MGLEPGDILLVTGGPLVNDNGVKIGGGGFIVGMYEIAVVGIIQIQFFVPVLEDAAEADEAAFIQNLIEEGDSLKREIPVVGDKVIGAFHSVFCNFSNSGGNGLGVISLNAADVDVWVIVEAHGFFPKLNPFCMGDVVARRKI